MNDDAKDSRIVWADEHYTPVFERLIDETVKKAEVRWVATMKDFVGPMQKDVQEIKRDRETLPGRVIAFTLVIVYMTWGIGRAMGWV